MISKNYNINIFKNIAVSNDEMSTPDISDCFKILEKQIVFGEIKNKSLCVINDITFNGVNTVITSNTLGILASNKNYYFNNKYYYYKMDISSLVAAYPTNYLSKLSTTLLDFHLYDETTILLNTKRSYYSIGEVVLYVKPILHLGLNKAFNYEHIKVKRLKNKFKVTISSSLEHVFKLETEYLYQPIQWHDSIRFNESVVLPEHTFTIQSKTELELKDVAATYVTKNYPLGSIVIQPYTNVYSKVSYNTYYSNLCFPAVIQAAYVCASGSRIYLTIDPTDTNILCSYTSKNVEVKTYLNKYKSNRIYKYNKDLLFYYTTDSDFFRLRYGSSLFKINKNLSYSNADYYVNNIIQKDMSADWSDIPVSPSRNTTGLFPSYLTDIYQDILSNPNLKSDNNSKLYEEVT